MAMFWKSVVSILTQHGAQSLRTPRRDSPFSSWKSRRYGRYSSNPQHIGEMNQEINNISRASPVKFSCVVVAKNLLRFGLLQLQNNGLHVHRGVLRQSIMISLVLVRCLPISLFMKLA